MTENNLLPFCFPAVCRKKITAAFDGGRISSDGGVILLAQADRRLGIAERLARGIPDRRDPDPGTHLLPHILPPRLLPLARRHGNPHDLHRPPLRPTLLFAGRRLPDSGPGLSS